MDMPKKRLVAEALIDLHRRLSALPSRSHDRRMIMRETAALYGVSEQTLYRALAERARHRALRRSDRGTPRVLPQDKMQSYCEVIAAIKVRTSNKKGRHLSTGEAIRLIEEFGVETPEGLAKAPKSTLKTTTVYRYLRQWGYDRETLRRQPAAVRHAKKRTTPDPLIASYYVLIGGLQRPVLGAFPHLRAEFCLQAVFVSLAPARCVLCAPESTGQCSLAFAKWGKFHFLDRNLID